MEIREIIGLFISATIGYAVFALTMAYTRPKAYLTIAEFLESVCIQIGALALSMSGGAYIMRVLIQTKSDNFYALSVDPQSPDYVDNSFYISGKIVSAGNGFLGLLGLLMACIVIVLIVNGAGRKVALITIREEGMNGPASGQSGSEPASEKQRGHETK